MEDKRKKRPEEKDKTVKHRTLHLGEIEYSLQDVSFAPGENTYLNEHQEGDTDE